MRSSGSDSWGTWVEKIVVHYSEGSRFSQDYDKTRVETAEESVEAEVLVVRYIARWSTVHSSAVEPDEGPVPVVHKVRVSKGIHVDRDTGVRVDASGQMTEVGPRNRVRLLEECLHA